MTKRHFQEQYKNDFSNQLRDECADLCSVFGSTFYCAEDAGRKAVVSYHQPDYIFQYDRYGLALQRVGALHIYHCDVYHFQVCSADRHVCADP